jgi:hypothetical protein
VKQQPKYPEYNRSRDGDVFKWLLKAANSLREERAEERKRELANLIRLEIDDKPKRSNRK